MGSMDALRRVPRGRSLRKRASCDARDVTERYAWSLLRNRASSASSFGANNVVHGSSLTYCAASGWCSSLTARRTGGEDQRARGDSGWTTGRGSQGGEDSRGDSVQLTFQTGILHRGARDSRKIGTTRVSPARGDHGPRRLGQRLLACAPIPVDTAPEAVQPCGEHAIRMGRSRAMRLAECSRTRWPVPTR